MVLQNNASRQPVSRILYGCDWLAPVTAIDLGWILQPSSCSLPAGQRNGPFRNAETFSRLFGLAPDGVYHATNRYRQCGELLPHRFTLTCAHGKSSQNIMSFIHGPSAVYSLLHYPSPRDARPLAGILSCGVRTFLPRGNHKGDRPAASRIIIRIRAKPTKSRLKLYIKKTPGESLSLKFSLEFQILWFR